MRFVLVFAVVASVGVAAAKEYTIPLAGNAFRTAPTPGREGRRRNGELAWSDTKSVYSVFFHLDRATELELRLRGAAAGEASTLKAAVDEEVFEVQLQGDAPQTVPLGRVAAQPGYVRIDLKGSTKRDADTFGVLSDLIVVPAANSAKLDYVRSNDGNMFYWGRRGPSVHLRYDVPGGKALRYAYSEVTVPEGQDPLGSFYMANGFGEGYFGMQVNGPKERRVLFSVWSPFKTDNPREIPKDQRIVALDRGPDVHIGEFGNEGSGGQSYLRYSWQAGKTYRFLTEVRPDGQGNTIYAAWFGDKQAKEWRLIARFRRPQTDTHLRGFHAFLESFSPTHGYQVREGRYGNVWVVDTEGEWHACNQARFSVDATGRGRHRLDFTGGTVGAQFFLRNCGFFSGKVKPGETFSARQDPAARPSIDFAKLP